MVVASNKPTTFDDAVDRAFTAEEVHREESADSAKRSSSGTTTHANTSWSRRGGPVQDRGKRQRFNARTEDKPVCGTCGKFHRTEACWRTAGACLIYGFMEHKMFQCPRARRDDRAPYQQHAQGQAVIPAPPRQLASPAPPVGQRQRPRQGPQRQWQQKGNNCSKTGHSVQERPME